MQVMAMGGKVITPDVAIDMAKEFLDIKWSKDKNEIFMYQKMLWGILWLLDWTIISIKILLKGC